MAAQPVSLPVAAGIDRLNRAGTTCHFRVASRDRETMGLNRWNDAIRQALGVQALDDGSGEDLLEGAGSDSLKKCASLFGVPLEG